MAQITDLTTETTILGADYIPFRKTSVGRDRAILFSDLKLSLSLGTMASATESNYLLASGSRAGASAGLQTFTSGIVTGIVRPESDSTTAFRVQDAAGTAIVTIDTTNKNVTTSGIMTVVKTPGDTSPNLSISGGTHPYMFFHNGVCYGKFQVIDGSNYFIIGTESNHDFYLYSNNSPRGRITAGGYWRIGDGTTPGTLLDVGASTTARASLRLEHGVAPTSPNDGDIWTTTAGLFVRINGATIGPLS